MPLSAHAEEVFRGVVAEVDIYQAQRDVLQAALDGVTLDFLTRRSGFALHDFKEAMNDPELSVLIQLSLLATSKTPSQHSIKMLYGYLLD